MEIKAIYKNSIVTVYYIKGVYYLLNSKWKVKKINKSDLVIIG